MPGERILNLSSIQPDYVGSWHGNRPDTFHLYILRRSKHVEIVHSPEGVEEEMGVAENIEGLITEGIGLAIFSGRRSKNHISFIKTYCRAAIAQGGLHEIEYTGDIDKKTGLISGKYSVLGTRISDDFTMRPFSTILDL